VRQGTRHRCGDLRERNRRCGRSPERRDIMIVMDFVFALVVALMLVVIFAVIFNIRPPGFGVAAFFVIVFLASWAGGVWMTPLGPTGWGVYWLPFLLVGLMVALLLAAVRMPPPEESTVELVNQHKRKGSGGRPQRQWGYFSGCWWGCCCWRSSFATCDLVSYTNRRWRRERPTVRTFASS
jgi:hypothetical protein